MGLVNIDSLINNSTFLSSTKKFVSSLDSANGSVDKDVRPKYIYPNDIDRQNAANYMIIYIYDNVKSSVMFQPISTQIAKSKVQNDLVKQLTDCITIDLKESTKEGLKNFKNTLLGRIKDLAKDWLKDFDFGEFAEGLGIDFETPEWIKQTGEFLQDNMLTRGVKDLVDAIDLPDFGSLNIPGLPELDLGKLDLSDLDPSKYFDVNINKEKLKAILKGVTETSTTDKAAPEAGEGFELISSIVLPLPINGISYESKIGIESTSTKTAQAIKSVVDAAIGEKGIFNSASAAAHKAWEVITDQSGELLYSMLGNGGSALYQNNFKQIRDPLLAFTYSIPDPRTFEYDFIMAPRDKGELFDIWNIIKTLKFYSHMSIEGSGAVRYYNFPARFKIKYYTEGNENVWLGKTKILGLTSIQSNIDTSNIGFIINDFDNMSGNPPRLIAVSMRFTELSILNREDINEGY